MPHEELLKQPEIKDEKNAEEQTPSPISLDQNRIQALIKIRLEKLQAVRSFISLKLFDQISAKLKEESVRLTSQLTEKKKEIAKQNREQALPKSFFEQRFMKIKSIRID